MIKRIFYFLFFSLFPIIAFAIDSTTSATVADVANGISGQVLSMKEILSYMSYIFGVVLGIKGILKLKDHAEDPRNKLITPIMFLLAAGIMISLPLYISIGQGTLGFSSTVNSSPSGVQY